MKVGVLYPSSKAHPGISTEFLGGLKAFLAHQALDKEISIVSDSVGFGGSEKEVYEKAEKLLVVEEVDILVAYIDIRVLPMAEPLFYSSGKLVIVVNPGANYPMNWVPQPNMIFLTLQHAFLNWMTGSLATNNVKKDAALASTFYDCGYMHSASMVKSYIRSDGTIGFNYVNNQRYDDNFHINELSDFLTTNKKSEVVLCVFDELPASLFYDRLNELDTASRLHLLVSPMMLQKKALERLSKGFKFDIEGYIPWDPSSGSEANNLFSDCLTKAKKEPTIFSLLGWETGIILQQVLLNARDGMDDGGAIVQLLAKAAINGPRGELKLDPHTNYFLSPVIKCSIESNADKIKMEQLGLSENEWNTYTEMPNEGISSGWTNTYLCY